MPRFSFDFEPAVLRLLAFVESAESAGVRWADVPTPLRDFQALRVCLKHKMAEWFAIELPRYRKVPGAIVPLHPFDDSPRVASKLRCTAYGRAVLADARQGEKASAAPQASPSTNTGHGEGEGGAEAGAVPKQPKRRGRPPDTDAKADQKIAEAWKTKSYKIYEDLGKEIGKTKLEVKKAIDRHRHRKPARKGRKK